jgi:hypothetical protein
MHTTIRTLPAALALVIACVAAPAHAQEDADAPIRTAPAELEMADVSIPIEAPTVIPPREQWALAPLTPSQTARGCSDTMTYGFQRGRTIEGVNVAPGKLVSANAFQHACGLLGGRLSGEFASTVLLDAKGTLGERGPADELRFTLTYRKEQKTPLGTIDLALFTNYRISAAPAGFESTNDDYTSLGFEIGYPMRFGAVTLRPYLISDKWNPVNNANSRHFWGPGGELTLPGILGSRLRLYGEHTRSEGSTGAGPHKQFWFAAVSARWRLPYNLAAEVGMRYDQYGKNDNGRGRCIRRDAKIELCPEANGTAVVLPQFGPFFQLSRHRTF